MSKKNVTKNMAVSIRNRLLAHSKAEKVSFNHILQLYAMERVLYRLSVSKYADLFYLKGALLFLVWDMPERRTTMDIDLLGIMDNSLSAVESVFSSVCSLEIYDDGLVFDLSSFRSIRIKEDADYEGVRITFKAKLDTAIITLQIDIGFNDAVKERQWKAFLVKSSITSCPESFSDLYDQIMEFLSPIYSAINSNTYIQGEWLPGECWIYKNHKQE